MPDTNRDYYKRRATEARALAEKAKDQMIAAIHREMSARYSELAAMDAEKPDLLIASG